jgi:hypothetical protein
MMQISFLRDHSPAGLRNGSRTTLRSTINIPTQGISTSCHREDRSFCTGWAGKNLQIRVGANYATVGVSYKVNSVVLFANI